MCTDALGDCSGVSSRHVSQGDREHRPWGGAGVVGEDESCAREACSTVRSSRPRILCTEQIHFQLVGHPKTSERASGNDSQVRALQPFRRQPSSHPSSQVGDIEVLESAAAFSRGAARSRPKMFLLAILVLLLSLGDASGRQPLLGASLSWKVSRRFTTGERLVNITLRSAFATADDCTYTVGRQVTCHSAALTPAIQNLTNASNSSSFNATKANMTGACKICDVAQHHGVLCVGQLVLRSGGLELLHSSDGAGPCVSDMHPFAKVSQSGASSQSGNSSNQWRLPLSQIGKVNNFIVSSTHGASAPNDRAGTHAGHQSGSTNGLSVAVGTLVHEVHVADHAVAVVAWLQRHAGESIMLPSCGLAGARAAACSVNSDPTQNLSWHYWQGLNVSGLPHQHILQTYIPLCTKTGNGSVGDGSWAVGSSCDGVRLNLHSPQPAFPFLIQVASTRGSAAVDDASTTFKSSLLGSQEVYGDGNFKAPHTPMYYRAHDADGDAMTDVVVPMQSAAAYAPRDYNVRCFLGGVDGAPLQPNRWPTRQCLAGRRKGFACSEDIECPSLESPSHRSSHFESLNESLSERCGETWSRCREYDEAGSTLIAGNLIKFDFDFTPHVVTYNTTLSCSNATCWDNCRASCHDTSVLTSYSHAHCMYACMHQAPAPTPFLSDDTCPSGGNALVSCNASRGAHFSQHLIFTLDSTRAPQAAAAHQPVMPTWATSPLTGASPLLFSAFPCDPGSENRPPTFVTGLDSTDTRVRTEYSCVIGEECEIPLFARDLSTDAEPRETTDDIAIEAALGFAPLDRHSLFRPDGSACRGRGALYCIYRLFAPEDRGLVTRASRESSYIRCFTTLDIHDAAAATDARSCSSLPLCVKIRITPLASWRALYRGIGVIKAFLEPDPREQQSFRGAHVYLRWIAAEVARVSSTNFTSALRKREVVVQFANRRVDLEENYFDLAPELITVNTTSEAFIRIRDLLAASTCALTECEFVFRFKFRAQNPLETSPGAGSADEAGYEMFHGPASNPLILVPRARAADKALLAAEWRSQVLRVWRVETARLGAAHCPRGQKMRACARSHTCMLDADSRRVRAGGSQVGKPSGRSRQTR